MDGGSACLRIPAWILPLIFAVSCLARAATTTPMGFHIASVDDSISLIGMPPPCGSVYFRTLNGTQLWFVDTEYAIIILVCCV